MTDAFWTAMWTSIPATIAATVAAVAALRGNASSRANSKVLDDVHEKVNGNLHAAVAAAEDSARRRTSPRILIVDDDLDAIELASVPLRKFGCEIFSARTAEEASSMLRDNIDPRRGYPFDFALIDLNIPCGGSDAIFDTFARIAPRVPIVILSGMRIGTLPTCIRGDIPIHWITKPLDESHVQSLLEQFAIPFRRIDGQQRPLRKERKTDRNGRKSDDKTIV